MNTKTTKPTPADQTRADRASIRANHNSTPYFPLQYSAGYQPETIEAMERLATQCPRTRAFQEAKLGMSEAEPLLVMMDAAIRYIKAYTKENDRKMVDDCMAAPEIRSILSGIRGFLNFNGGVAYEKGITTDSKDNGMIESLFWKACDLAGIDGNDI
jgi:hypothetical protein